MRITCLVLLTLCLILAAVPLAAQTVYSNGPTNGNIDAWTINFGFIVSDTFSVNTLLDSAHITGASFAMWLFPGDNLTSAELSITSGENGGVSFFDGFVNFTQGACTANHFGYNVCQENTSFDGPTLTNGTYWLNLQNASVPSGDPVFWDESSGPSQASQNTVGSIPSESFTVLGVCPIGAGSSGCGGGTSTSTSTTTSIPEPSSIMLFGSGILALASVLRRRLF